MAADDSIDIGDVEPKLQNAYDALAKALAAWDTLKGGKPEPIVCVHCGQPRSKHKGSFCPGSPTTYLEQGGEK
jgi:hypothetical protein